MNKMDKIDEFFDKALIRKESGTRTVYKSHIKKYFKVINKKINTYFDEKQPYEEDIREYWKYLEGKATVTQGVAISAIKGFLKAHDKSTKELDIWDSISQILKRTRAPEIEEHVPDIDEIKHILDYCKMREKTAIMVSLSSGMRIGEVTKLLPSDIHLNEEPTRVNIRSEISKNRKRRTTFISPETTELLKEWLRGKDDYVKNSLKTLNFKNMAHIKNRVDNRIFPVDNGNIRIHFNTACNKAGFNGKTLIKGDFDQEHKRSRRHLRFHNLRKFFRTYLGNADLSEHLMGHSGYLSQYRQKNDKQLAKEYMNFVHNVTVFERLPDLTEVNKSLSEKDKEIMHMRQEMHELRNMISELGNKKLDQLKEEQEKQ